MSTPLENLQTAYADVTAKIAQVFANPKPNYTVDGVVMDRRAYYMMLLESEKQLRSIPGVATETLPSFQMDEYL